MSQNENENCLLSSPAGNMWKIIGIRQHHGIVIPLFSLYSHKSCGLGEFPDLLPVIDWCNTVGFDVIQLLPLNDTGMQPSPYSALSATALNPMHLGLASLPNLDQSFQLVALAQEIAKETKWNERIQYSTIYSKRQYFLKLYLETFSDQILHSQDYQSFILKNSWLKEYALFKTLKIQQQWKHWEDWPLELKNPSIETCDHLLKEYNSEISFHMILQYLCFQQLQHVKHYANEHKVLLKGDIPILINRDSADVWFYRSYFQLQHSAGAPPDMYAKDGQNWGFPIYHWEMLETDDYQWWKQRLQIATLFYDIYRLDHVVGFFRIWAIPIGKLGREGKFIPEDPSIWIPHGKKILQMMLESCPMLPIGEDLGTVPSEVRKCLKELGICGTKVMRWERLWDEKDQPFIPFDEYTPVSMTTVSTHDSDTILLWWKNSVEEAKKFADFMGLTYQTSLSKENLFSILQASHHTKSLFHINLLNEYLALIPGLTWPNPQDERINIPGVITEHNWSYRFRKPVEELVTNQELKDLIKAILK